MKELDVLLERFATGELTHASSEERARFGELLELPDPVLVDWLLAGATPAPPFAVLIARIRGEVQGKACTPTASSEG
jgi:succinate dehydrogenase flavin-adding protein (antitoxin of CptAB toxin-antitoxin module)